MVARESKILKETSIHNYYDIPRLCPTIVSRDSELKPIGRVTAVSSRPVIIHIIIYTGNTYYYILYTTHQPLRLRLNLPLHVQQCNIKKNEWMMMNRKWSCVRSCRMTTTKVRVVVNTRLESLKLICGRRLGLRQV